jgi:hypothetical protein
MGLHLLTNAMGSLKEVQDYFANNSDEGDFVVLFSPQGNLSFARSLPVATKEPQLFATGLKALFEALDAPEDIKDKLLEIILEHSQPIVKKGEEKKKEGEKVQEERVQEKQEENVEEKAQAEKVEEKIEEKTEPDDSVIEICRIGRFESSIVEPNNTDIAVEWKRLKIKEQALQLWEEQLRFQQQSSSNVSGAGMAAHSTPLHSSDTSSTVLYEATGSASISKKLEEEERTTAEKRDVFIKGHAETDQESASYWPMLTQLRYVLKKTHGNFFGYAAPDTSFSASYRTALKYLPR